MSRLLRVAALASLVVASLACEAQRGALYVDVQTDLVPELEVATLEVEILDERARLVTREGPIVLRREDAVAFLERGVRVASFEALASGRYTVRVAGREPTAPGLPLDGGPVLVARSVLVSLESSRVVRVVLGARCTDVTCPDGDDLELTACLNGRCVSPTCDVSAGAVCDEPAPCVDGDPEACTAPPACASAICRAGACLNEPIAGACPEGEYCGRLGCEPIPGVTTPDGGMPDAWVEVPDAYEPPPPDASGPCGPIGTACDDGNACTGSDACTATGCEGTPLSGTACGVRNECRNDTCMAGVCERRDDANGSSCGTRNTCRLDECRSGVCTRVNAGNGTACGTRTACRADACAAGACERVDVRAGTACSDGDGNPCTSGECSAGSCRAARRPDGTGCGSGNLCCSGSCIDPDTNGAHCGVCGLSCGGRGCQGGLCRCSTTSQCTGEYGGAATCWDSTEGSDPAGMHCQCQCSSGTTCDACPGSARCREETGYNHCYYP